ncbi:CapA family protein [Bacillus sp. FJAT-22090]|uniref:CapA family protein n=1 Tax=Bacillus sp. FJAT-22090 TaxID=1581038 RepID=UPI0037C03317
MKNCGCQVDIIFGHHPHVIQPYEEITTSSGHRIHVFYSLGISFLHRIWRIRMSVLLQS